MLGRLKFQIDGLVDEILDQIPVWAWTNPSVTFLDPAMGGAQFLLKIVDKIVERLLGVGSFDFDYESEFGLKKFDVIIGNPPYNIGNTDGPQVYTKFVNQALGLNPDLSVFLIPSQIGRSYNSQVVECFNNLVNSGLTKIEEKGYAFSGEANLKVSYTVTMRGFGSFKVKQIPEKGPYKFKGFKNIIKVAGKSRYFSGMKGSEECFEDTDYKDSNPKNHADKYRIIAPYIHGGTYRWLEKGVIIAPGESASGSWRFLECDSKEHAEKLLSYFKSEEIMEIVENTAYSRTLDGTQTAFIPEMPL